MVVVVVVLHNAFCQNVPLCWKDEAVGVFFVVAGWARPEADCCQILLDSCLGERQLSPNKQSTAHRRVQQFS